MIQIAPSVAEALAAGRPVVALESALITHGLPHPTTLVVAGQLEEAVMEVGAVPATVGVVAGTARVGLSPAELERLASHPEPVKVSLRDLPVVLARGETGGTTVAATMHLAHRAGIPLFATGGIGGVHRGHPEDVSADLTALASIPITVVCAGAKSILDLPRTLEGLETRGVVAVGYRTSTFPAFFTRSSGLPLPARADSPSEAAAMVRARDRLGLPAAVLVCVPIPEEAELPPEEAEAAIQAGIAEAEEQGIEGRDLTPFLLSRLAEATGHRSLQANIALLLNNVRVAARIAQALGGWGAG